MKKHKFNIFPEMNSEDYTRLKNDIKTNGYDEKQPIYIYEDEILDGWHRNKACKELGIAAVYVEITCSHIEAINLVMRSNKRRNLTSSQCAALAVEAEGLIETIKEEAEKKRREKQAKTQKGDNEEQLSDNKLSHRSKNEDEPV